MTEKGGFMPGEVEKWHPDDPKEQGRLPVRSLEMAIAG